MNPSITLIFLSLFISSCNDSSQNKVQLTDILNHINATTKQTDSPIKSYVNKVVNTKFELDTVPKISIGKMTLISSGQTATFNIVKINGYDFDLVTNKKDTIYLATTDKKFQTPEGYKIGTTFSELHLNSQDKRIPSTNPLFITS